MEKEEIENVKLWLENRESQVNESLPGILSYKSKSFKLKSSLVKSLDASIKTRHLGIDRFIKSAWGLLLCHFSATTSYKYFSGNAHLVKGNIKSLSSMMLHDARYQRDVTVNNLLKSRCSEKPISTKHLHAVEQARYLLAFSIKGKAKSLLECDVKSNMLVLVAPQTAKGRFVFYYNPAVFSSIAIQNLIVHFEKIVSELCHNIDTATTEINVLLPDEEKLLLETWRGKHSPKNVDITTLVHEKVAIFAKEHPLRLAVCHNDKKMTYQELHQTTCVIAKQLLLKEIQPGDAVAILIDRSTALIASILATFKVGGIYVPINTKYPCEKVEYVLTDCQPQIILTDNLEKIPDHFRDKGLSINDFINDDEVPDDIPYPIGDAKEIAYILYTSGTTGYPKGVKITHRGINNLSAWYQYSFKLSPKDQVSQFASQGFDTHLCEIIPTLMAGATMHIIDDSIKLSPQHFFDWLVHNKITICDLPTAYAQILLKLQWPNRIKLRFIKIGGETLAHHPTQTLPFDLWNIYGPTEATIEATYEKIYTANHKPTKSHQPPLIGKPLFNSEVVIVDKYLKPAPIGVAGELLIGGLNISAGYLNRSELNEQRFIAGNTFLENNSTIFYRTGDLARWMPNGHIDFIGRVDHQIKIRGYRIELGEIENALSRYPDVNEAIVVAKENIKGEKTIVSYVASNLESERFLFQERCLITLDDHHFYEAVSDDISKCGIALSGIPDHLNIGDKSTLHIKLPGMNDAATLHGVVIWKNAERCGLSFKSNKESLNVMSKSINYYLSKHNVVELILSSSAKRNLRKALAKKLPEYMIPNSVIKMLELPLTFSGKVDVKSLPEPEEYSKLVSKEYIPAKTKTEKRLEKIWRDLLNLESISMSDNFFDIGGNSLLAAELSINIVNTFGITIPVNVLFDLSYIPILSQYIETNGKNYNNQSITQIDIKRDIILQESITPPANIGKHNTYKNILLTGAGGFLGIYILRSLLKNTDATIHCLVRKGEFQSAAMKLMSTVEKFRLHDDITLAEKRIIVIESDISYSQFGLVTDHYNSLANKIDLIYHCGAQVNIMASYNMLRGSNVTGTLEVIKFANLYKPKPIHYISTLSSAYVKDHNGHLAETFPKQEQEGLFGGYAISKWVSEYLLTQMNERGLPVTIYRSGYILGQSDNGVTSLNDGLLMLMKSCIQLGFAPKLQEKIALLPVDFVSDTIVHISKNHPNDSNVYHIDHPTGIMWVDLVQWMNSYGFPIKLITIAEWKEKLKSISKDNVLYPFLPYYLSLDERYLSPEVSVDKTKRMLEEVGIPYPSINDTLLTTYFDYLCHVGFFPTDIQQRKKVT